MTKRAQYEPRSAAERLAWEAAGELEHDSEIEALIEEAETPAPRAFTMLRWAAAAAVLVVVLVGVVVWRWSPREELYTTAVGERRVVVLPDQSRVTLNTATRVRVAYSKSLRSIVLEQGEATFSVARDTDHPFEVKAAGGTVRALGTQFNVLEGERNVTVSVLQGKIEVAAAAPSAALTSAAVNRTVLSDGQEVSYSPQGMSSIHAGSAERIRAWHAGRILFQDVSLAEAIVQFNRYSRMELVLGDPSLSARRVTGTFRIGETGAFLNALHEAFGVRAVVRGNAIVLWPAPADAPPLQRTDG